MVEHDGVGTLVFGDADNTIISEKVAAVRDFFDKIDIEYKIPEDMIFVLWSKFMIKVGNYFENNGTYWWVKLGIILSVLQVDQ